MHAHLVLTSQQDSNTSPGRKLAQVCRCIAPEQHEDFGMILPNVGWKVDQDAFGGSWLVKQWIHDGTVNGVPHNRHDLKRSWEVIRDSSIHSYRMEHNPTYRVRADMYRI